MRVLHFYSGNLFGGVEKLLVELQRKKNLCSNIEFQFALCFEGLLSQNLEKEGVIPEIIGAARLRKPWTVWQARRRLKKFIDKSKPNIVICHEIWSYFIATPVVQKKRLPLVSWHHSRMGHYWLDHYMKLSNPDLALSCSKYVAESLEGTVSKDRIRVFYAPVSPSRFTGSKETKNNEVIILHAGRLDPNKGQKELLSAIAKLKDLPIRVWMAGGVQNERQQNFLNDLIEFCKRTGIDRKVNFLGHRNDLEKLYAEADIYCQPNTSAESYGLTFIEAGLAGLPVVTSRLGGAIEILEENGILLPPGDEKSLVQELRKLIEDQDYRKKMGLVIKERVQKISTPELQMKEFEKLMGTL